MKDCKTHFCACEDQYGPPFALLIVVSDRVLFDRVNEDIEAVVVETLFLY